MKATAKDLRFHSKELIDSVSRGESESHLKKGLHDHEAFSVGPGPDHAKNMKNALVGITVAFNDENTRNQNHINIMDSVPY